jgi:hypothetical protein
MDLNMQLPIDMSTFNSIKLEKEIEPMKTGKAKGWGWEYHWVQPAVTEDNKYSDLKTEAFEWCKTQFGKSGARWFEKQGKFYFRSEQDMTMFILRWS